MTIGSKIMSLRKKQNLTQEQLANAVGVSVPAVSKWEHNITMPDISLLAPVARMLGTDINDLMSFQDELSDREVERYMAQVKERCKTEGYREGMKYAYQILKEYPNCVYLKLEVASAAMMYSFAIESDYTQEELDKEIERSIKLLEEIVFADVPIEDPGIRSAAVAVLTSRYMSAGKLDDAERLLKSMPESTFNGKQMLPAVYLMQERLGEAMNAAQQNFLLDVQTFLADIRTMHTISLKKQEYSLALEYAKDYRQIVNNLHVPYVFPSELLLDTYLAQEDIENAAHAFADYVKEVTEGNPEYTKCIYLADIAEKVVVWRNDVQEDMKTAICKSIQLNPSYTCIHDTIEYKKGMERLKTQVSVLS